MHWLWRKIASALLIVIITLSLLIFLEGGASFYRALSSIAMQPMSRYIKYDPLLGWTTVPDVYARDVYNKGDYFQTNSQGFRNKENFPKEVPTGKIRIICSGDSFTIGYGVDNDHTWCNLLSTQLPDTETINMGQDGHGIDQIYLRHMRDGTSFDHQLQVFAFIDNDFNRALQNNLQGYPKPYFTLKDNELVLNNVPVPNLLLSPSLMSAYMTGFKRLAIMEALVKWYDRIFPATSRNSQQETYSLGLRIFEKTLEEANQKHREVVFVMLPVISASGNIDDTEHQKFRRMLADEMAKRNMHFIDLTDGFKEAGDARGLYRSDRHFNEKGNKLVADLLYSRLVLMFGENPSFAAWKPSAAH